MKAKIYLGIVLWIFLILPLVIAPDQDPTGTVTGGGENCGASPTPKAGCEMQWLGNDGHWTEGNTALIMSTLNTQPGFYDDPRFMTNAQKLLSGALTYERDTFQIAQEYVKRVNFHSDSQAVKIGDKFFSKNSIKSIGENTRAAINYFQVKYQKDYTFAKLASDFRYDAEEGTMTNSGKTLVLTQYQDQADVTLINVVENGFMIMRQKSAHYFAGDGSGTINYDPKENIYTLGDYIIKPSEEQEGKLPTDLRVVYSKSGDIEIVGEAAGKTKDGAVAFTNRRGNLIIRANGDFDASRSNSELHSSKYGYYFDGTGTKRGKEVTLQDHGDSKLGNTRATQSVYIDLDTKVGVVSNGQNQINKGTLTIHLDQYSGTSRHKTTTGPVDAQQIRKAREDALNLRPTQGDLGESGEVWIKKEGKDTIVYAKGKVEVGLYTGKVLTPAKPFFRGESGKSEYELKTDGRTEVDLRGLASYVDGQFGEIKYDGNSPRISAGIHNEQEGASLLLQRDKSGSDDSLTESCFGCQAGRTVTTFKKNVIIGDKVADGILENGQLGTIDFSTIATDKGLSFGASLQKMGVLAQQISPGKNVALGRNLIFKIDLGSDQEQYLKLVKPAGAQDSLVAETETFQRSVDKDGKVTLTKTGEQKLFDLGVRNVIGNAFVITSPQNKENLVKLLTLLDQKKYGDLAKAGLVFGPDEELRQYVLDSAGIDISQVNKPGYLTAITKSFQAQQAYSDLSAQLKKDHGIVLDDWGKCTAPPDCQKKISAAQKGATKLAYLWIQAQQKLLEAQKGKLQANQRGDLETAKNIYSDAVKDIDSKIKKYQQLKRGMDASVQRKKAAPTKRTGISPTSVFSVDADTLEEFSNAYNTKQVRDNTAKELQRAEATLANLKASEKTAPEYKKYCVGRDCEIVFVKSDIQSKRIQTEARVQSLRAQLKDMDSEIDLRITAQGENPIHAAHLASAYGRNDRSAEIIQEEIAPIEPETANLLLMQNSLDYGNFAEANRQRLELAPESEARKYADKKVNEELVRQLEESAKQKDEEHSRAQEEQVEKYSGFMGGLNWFGKETATAGLGLSAGISGNWGNYKEISDKWTNRKEGLLSSEYLEIKGLADTVEVYRKAGKTPEEIMQILSRPKEIPSELLPKEGDTPEEAARKTAARSQFVQTAALSPLQTMKMRQFRDGVEGKDPDPALAASIKMEEANQIISREGKITAALPLLREAYHDPHAPPEVKIAVAQRMEELRRVYGLFDTEFYETYGEMAMEVGGDITNLIPVATIYKGTKALTSAQRGAKVVQAVEKVKQLETALDLAKDTVKGAQEAVKVAETAGDAAKVVQLSEEATKAAKVVKDTTAALETARASAEVVQKQGTVSKVLERVSTAIDATKDKLGFEPSVSRKLGAAIDESTRAVAAAEEAFKAGRGTEEALVVARVAQQQARDAQQAYKLARGTSTSALSRDIGLRSARKTALTELRSAATDIKPLIRELEQTGDIRKFTEAVTAAPKLADGTSTTSKATKIVQASKAAEEAEWSTALGRWVYTKRTGSSLTGVTGGAQAAKNGARVMDDAAAAATGGKVEGALPDVVAQAAHDAAVLPNSPLPEAAVSIDIVEGQKVIQSQLESAAKGFGSKLDDLLQQRAVLVDELAKAANSEHKAKLALLAAHDDALLRKMLQADPDKLHRLLNENEDFRKAIGAVVESSNAVKKNLPASAAVAHDAVALGDDSLRAKAAAAKVAEEASTAKALEAAKRDPTVVKPELAPSSPKLTPEQIREFVLPKAKVSDVNDIKSGQRGVVGLGDSHGTYVSIDEATGRKAYLFDDINGITRDAGGKITSQERTFISGDPEDISSWRWTGKDGVVVQVGDIYDRGDHAFEIRNAFNRLAAEAEAQGGRFVRVTGNHELLILGGDFWAQNGMDAETFWLARKQIIEDLYGIRLGETPEEIGAKLGISNPETVRSIFGFDDKTVGGLKQVDPKLAKHKAASLSKILELLKSKGIVPNPEKSRLVAAAVVDGHLYTHAGVNLDVLTSLGLTKSSGLTATEVAQRINTRFIEALRSGDIKSDLIFGKKGIFWYRVDPTSTTSLNSVDLGFLQARGHDIIGSNFVEDIAHYRVTDTLSDGTKVDRTVMINLDVGRSNAYGGGKGAFTNAPHALSEEQIAARVKQLEVEQAAAESWPHITDTQKATIGFLEGESTPRTSATTTPEGSVIFNIKRDLRNPSINGITLEEKPLYRMSWIDKGIEEHIIVDQPDPGLEGVVRESYQNAFGGLSDNPTPKELEDAAMRLSFDLRDKLPFLGYEKHARLKAWEAQGGIRRDFYNQVLWPEYFERISEGPVRLSDLSRDGMLDCTGQHLTIQLSLPGEGWELYKDVHMIDGNLVLDDTGKPSTRVHTFLAKRYGDQVVMIDSTELNKHHGFVRPAVEFDAIYSPADVVACPTC